jgi:hypothetical protein
MHPEACVDPAEASNADATAHPVLTDAAAAARAREEEESALLWRSFASTAAAARAAGAGAGTDASGAPAAQAAAGARTLACLCTPTPGLLPELDEGKEVLHWNVGKTATAAATAKVPAQGWASYCPDYTAEAAPASAAALSAAAVPPNADAYFYAKETDGENQPGGGGGGAAWWTIGGCAPGPPPTASSRSPAAAGPAPWAASLATAPMTVTTKTMAGAITVPSTGWMVAEHGSPEFLQQPKVQMCVWLSLSAPMLLSPAPSSKQPSIRPSLHLSIR